MISWLVYYVPLMSQAAGHIECTLLSPGDLLTHMTKSQSNECFVKYFEVEYMQNILELNLEDQVIKYMCVCLSE